MKTAFLFLLITFNGGEEQLEYKHEISNFEYCQDIAIDVVDITTGVFREVYPDVTIDYMCAQKN